MAFYKCCVGDCESTSNSHKLFCMPANDNLRNLWMSFLVPTNANLLGLSKNQLLKKRVCMKHFDETQFDQAGVRIRYSYPCLFTQMEILHGVPLSTEEYAVRKEHNYCQVQVQDDAFTQADIVTVTGMLGDVRLNEHQYSLPSTSQPTCQSGDDVSSQAHQFSLPSTSHTPQTSELLDFGATVNVGDENNALKVCKSNNAPQNKTGFAITQFSGKTRRYIRKCTDLAKNTSDDSSCLRLQNELNQSEIYSLMMDFNKLNKRAKTFLLMQLRLASKKVKARRYSLDDKFFSLSLWKQNPKEYKLLKYLFALPNKRTLARLSEKITFEYGINKNIFDHIKATTKGWDMKKKLCSLVFDEVALTPRLIYNESKDKINGFVEIAEERKQKFADHALVFMIRGICSSWRQSIAYYFCSGTVSAAELQNILKLIIPCLADAGLVPLALVCDQGTTFRSCFKILREDSARIHSTQGRDGDNTINVAGHELFLFYDPPHLLKGIRNNFIEKDILFQEKRATWKDILYVYDLDNKSGHTRALPKLTAEHVDPKKIKKMKVKAAAQVLSARTAAMLNYTHEVHKQLNSCMDTMETTAAVVLFFDELFDSVNGSPGGVKGKLRCAVTNKSSHQDFWRKALTELKKMKFIDTTNVGTQDQLAMPQGSYSVFTHLTSKHLEQNVKQESMEQVFDVTPADQLDQSDGIVFDFPLTGKQEKTKQESDTLKSEQNQSEFNNTPDTSKRIKCTEILNGKPCFYKTNTEDRLIRHIRVVHRGENPFQCTMCDYSTYNKAVFEEHVRIHEGIKPFKCRFCPYRSVSKKNTKKHEERHRPDNPLKCTQCEFIARHERSLQLHIKSHTGYIQCTLCDFKADSPWAFKSHKKQKHAQPPEKPHVYECDACDAKFAELQSCKTHKKKAKKCEECGAVLCTKLIYNTHMTNVHQVSVEGDVIFKCALCEWSSSNKPKILLHLIHHPDQVVNESLVDISILKKFGIM